MSFIFRNRTQAGQMLAAELMVYAQRPDVTVIALPRGGVPVAYEVAKSLNLPLDICIVRKLGIPTNPELAMGAIASDGIRILNSDIISGFNISSQTIDIVAEKELGELQRCENLYRNNLPKLDLCQRTVILVDDGIATGSTIRAAIAILLSEHPKGIVVAVPVAPPEVYKQLKTEVKEVVFLIKPEPFYTVGFWYEDFSQVTDEKVRYLVQQAALSWNHVVGSEKIQQEIKAKTNTKQPEIALKNKFVTKLTPKDLELLKILREHQVE
jgi:putative phosphoribosyl transferase